MCGTFSILLQIILSNLELIVLLSRIQHRRGSFIKRQTSDTSSDNQWQRVTIPANFSFFFQTKEEPSSKHPKENFLNLEEDLWRRPIELRAETSTQKEILTVRSRNCRSSCSQIFTKIMFLKILQYSPFNRFAGFKTCSILKKGLQHRCFPVLEPLFK